MGWGFTLLVCLRIYLCVWRYSKRKKEKKTDTVNTVVCNKNKTSSPFRNCCNIYDEFRRVYSVKGFLRQFYCCWCRWREKILAFCRRVYFRKERFWAKTNIIGGGTDNQHLGTRLDNWCVRGCLVEPRGFKPTAHARHQLLHICSIYLSYFSPLTSRFLSRDVDSGFFCDFCFNMVQSKT